MQLQLCRIMTFMVIGWIGTELLAQPAPVFTDRITDTSKISGRWGSGIFSADGYTLTQSGGTDDLGHPRSVDFVWYNLPGVCSDGSGTIEFDVTGLFPNEGCIKNELLVACDSTGLNPATDGDDFYSSPYTALMRKDNYTPGTNVNKMKISAGAIGGAGFEDRTNVLSWNGTTTYRFRLTWSGTSMRGYRGLPGETLTLLSPPMPFYFGVAWSPGILHVQLGSTFRAGPRGVRESGGAPGTRYSCFRVYEEDIGNVATPHCRCSIVDMVSINLESQDIEECLFHPQPGDGTTTGTTIGGRSCRRNVDPNSDYYFYFDIDDDWAYQGSKPEVYILVDYYDTGSGTLRLEYDSASGAYTNGGNVALTGSNTWKQREYHVTNAYFGNRQNDGSDFRIARETGNTFYLDIVRVSDSPICPISPAANPDPPDQATGIGRATNLSWSAVSGATQYEVFFGDTDPPPSQGLQSQTTYDPPVTLNINTEYFWRINAINEYCTIAGGLWSFSTENWPVDFDDDQDCDQEDYGYLQACFSGVGFSYGPGCAAADLDLDNDVDAADLDAFLLCMSGADNAPKCWP